jgi:CBS domain-containing protein
VNPPSLRDLAHPTAWVLRSATFREAAGELCESGLSAIAVLDESRRVAGLFTEDDFLAGLFPRYLSELRHTAFVPDEVKFAGERAREVGGEPVSLHMRPPVIVEEGTSLLHAAEVFLHCEWGALAVVENGTFVGMLAQIAFCRHLLPSLEA